MKLRPKLIAVVVFLIALAVFAAAAKIGHPGGGYLKGFSNGG
jgi:hypothetical protein